MVDIDTRNAAVDKIDHRMIDVLHDWMVREKRNLDGYINHPEGHADYNQYLIIDMDALNKRSIGLGHVGNAVNVISEYKKGNQNVTRGMHDTAVDAIPAIIYKRLYDWTHKRASDMGKLVENFSNNPPVPIADYEGIATFNIDKYVAEFQMYKDATEGLEVVLQYITEKG